MADDPTNLPTPENAPPAAVVRRRGETGDQLQAREQGFSDEQIGYGTPRGVSALDRSARLALAREREARMAAQQDQSNSLAERSYALREKEFAAQQQVHASAQRDKDAALNQAAAYLQEEDALANKFGLYTKPYIEGALAAARKYPAAVLGDSRIGQKLQHYEEFYAKNLGGNPELPTALWEVGAFDPKSLPPEQAAQYLGTLAGKYPTVANDKSFMDLVGQKMKDVTARGNIATATAAGQVPVRTVAETNGGNVTFETPKTDSAGFKGTPEEARAHFGEGATIRETAKGVWTAVDKPDTFKAFNDELAQAVAAYGTAADVPAEVWASFEARKRAITAPKKAQTEVPTLTSKAEFDALPSKAFYIRDGKRFQKP